MKKQRSFVKQFDKVIKFDCFSFFVLDTILVVVRTKRFLDDQGKHLQSV